MTVKPLKFYVLPRDAILRACPVPADFLASWEALRPDVLQDDHVDIFLPNCRTEKQRWQRYDLFERVSEPSADTLIVCMSWLEIFLASGCRCHIATLMQHVRDQLPNNPTIYSWNHDDDSAEMPEFQHLRPNELIANFNTSRPSENDICLPFWSIETRQEWSPENTRPLHGGFIGAVGGVPVRRKLVDAFSGRDGWFIQDARFQRLSQADYGTMMLTFNFALCPRGGGLSSYRFWEALQCGAVPVLFADRYILPFQDRVDWPEITVRLPESDAGSFDVCWDILGGIDVKKRRQRIAEVRSVVSLAGVHEELAKRVRGLL